jgi:hypothetical protein
MKQVTHRDGDERRVERESSGGVQEVA